MERVHVWLTSFRPGGDNLRISPIVCFVVWCSKWMKWNNNKRRNKLFETCTRERANKVSHGQLLKVKHPTQNTIGSFYSLLTHFHNTATREGIRDERRILNISYNTRSSSRLFLLGHRFWFLEWKENYEHEEEQDSLSLSPSLPVMNKFILHSVRIKKIIPSILCSCSGNWDSIWKFLAFFPERKSNLFDEKTKEGGQKNQGREESLLRAAAFAFFYYYAPSTLERVKDGNVCRNSHIAPSSVFYMGGCSCARLFGM